MTQPNIQDVKAYLLQLQDTICRQLEAEDGQTKFMEDLWQSQLGSGRTQVITDGPVIEKCGVNFSHIKSDHLPSAATDKRPELIGTHYQALGVSVVVHPRNPYAPTAHLNVRFFMAEKPDMQPVWWFGGGFDLTPYYGFKDDCVHWHQTAKEACQPFGPDIYQRFKQQCDDYFFIRHRNEPRGIGGLFFDDLNQWEFTKCFDFMRSIGDHFLRAYQPILARRKALLYDERERAFQCYRRGRYVEFNLVYDRGTLFGLQSAGRIESILVSLPPNVTWHYNKQFSPGSIEANFYDNFLKPRDWLAQ